MVTTLCFISKTQLQLFSYNGCIVFFTISHFQLSVCRSSESSLAGLTLRQIETDLSKVFRLTLNIEVLTGGLQGDVHVTEDQLVSFSSGYKALVHWENHCIVRSIITNPLSNLSVRKWASQNVSDQYASLFPISLQSACCSETSARLGRGYKVSDGTSDLFINVRRPEVLHREPGEPCEPEAHLQRFRGEVTLPLIEKGSDKPWLSLQHLWLSAVCYRNQCICWAGARAAVMLNPCLARGQENSPEEAL